MTQGDYIGLSNSPAVLLLSAFAVKVSVAYRGASSISFRRTALCKHRSNFARCTGASKQFLVFMRGRERQRVMLIKRAVAYGARKRERARAARQHYVRVSVLVLSSLYEFGVVLDWVQLHAPQAWSEEGGTN